MGQCCPVPGTYWGSWNTTLQTKRDDCALHCRRKKYRIIVPQIWKNHLIKSITLVWNFKVNQLWPKEGSPLSIWHSLSMKSSRLTSYFMVKPGIRQGRLSLSLLSVYLNGSLSQGIREEKVILLSWKTWDLAYLQMTRCWSWRIMKKSSMPISANKWVQQCLRYKVNIQYQVYLCALKNLKQVHTQEKRLTKKIQHSHNNKHRKLSII